jgi:hypothetical protein
MSTPSVLLIPDLLKAGKLYSQIPNSGAVDFDVTRATTAFRTNASGILQSVASGVPRLDYPIGGGCPSLLVEPAATNLLLRSEEFDVTWSQTRGTITANNTIAPNGTTTADLWAQNSGETTAAALLQSTIITSGTIYSLSVFAKKQNKNFLGIRANAVSATPSYFDLQNGTLGTINPLHTARIENYGNGWYKCSITYTASSAGLLGHILYPTDGSSLTVTDSGGIFLWGAQLETGSVATSYIPTVAATATRNADVISKTGVSGFIGQTEGTLYAEVDLRNAAFPKALLAVSDGTLNNRINITFESATSLFVTLRVASANLDYSATIPAIPAIGGIYKAALAYQANNFALALNGTTYTPTSPALVPALSAVFLGQSGGAGNILRDRIRAAAIYPTRLTNSQLESLTTL